MCVSDSAFWYTLPCVLLENDSSYCYFLGRNSSIIKAVSIIKMKQRTSKLDAPLFIIQRKINCGKNLVVKKFVGNAE